MSLPDATWRGLTPRGRRGARTGRTSFFLEPLAPPVVLLYNRPAPRPSRQPTNPERGQPETSPRPTARAYRHYPFKVKTFASWCDLCGPEDYLAGSTSTLPVAPQENWPVPDGRSVQTTLI